MRVLPPDDTNNDTNNDARHPAAQAGLAARVRHV